MSVSKFLMPEEELWVRQGYVGDTDDINEMFIRIAKNPTKFRSPQIVSFSAGEKHNAILMTYEENINERKPT